VAVPFLFEFRTDNHEANSGLLAPPFFSKGQGILVTMYPEAAGASYQEPKPHGVVVYGEQIAQNIGKADTFRLGGLGESSSAVEFCREMKLQYLVYRFVAVIEGFHKVIYYETVPQQNLLADWL
jgi:hypothetical protein